MNCHFMAVENSNKTIVFLDYFVHEIWAIQINALNNKKVNESIRKLIRTGYIWISMNERMKFICAFKFKPFLQCEKDK